jgi:hypothetical protein
MDKSVVNSAMSNNRFAGTRLVRAVCAEPKWPIGPFSSCAIFAHFFRSMFVSIYRKRAPLLQRWYSSRQSAPEFQWRKHSCQFPKKDDQLARIQMEPDISPFSSRIVHGMTRRFGGAEPLCTLRGRYDKSMIPALPIFAIEPLQSEPKQPSSAGLALPLCANRARRTHPSASRLACQRGGRTHSKPTAT